MNRFSLNVRWHDVSIPIHDGTTVWPGDDPVRLVAASRIAEGASCNTSTITLPTHTGTHCDAPWHFEDGGRKLHEIDPEIYIAPYKNSGPTHHTLLENDVFVVEGLCLRDVPAGTYPFVVLPMPIHDADGAPCRAFVGLPR
jgi:kynurenine formamidase